MVLLLVFLAVAASAATAWAWFEAGWLRRNVIDVELAGVPPELDGLRIAHLSDLHLGAPSRGLRAVREAVEWVVERQPDIVCITGDLVSRRSGMRELERLLAELPLSYVVLGNHDFADSRDPFSQRVDPAAIGALENVTAPRRRGHRGRAARAARPDRRRRCPVLRGADGGTRDARRLERRPPHSSLPLPGNRAAHPSGVPSDPRRALPRRADRRSVPGRKAPTRAPARARRRGRLRIRRDEAPRLCWPRHVLPSLPALRTP